MIDLKSKLSIVVILIFICSIQVLAQEKYTVYFDTDVSDLSKVHKSNLDSLITDFSNKTLVIEGQSDSRASARYNLTLSEQRAQSVKSYLVQKGLSEQNLKVISLGEQKAQLGNHKEYRKVTISYKKDSIIPKVQETNIQDLYKSYQDNIQNFCINNSRDTVLKCEKGTLINIKANSFDLNNNTNCIVFQVKEIFDFSEMILENLSTTSDGRILETQGMIYTNAMLGNDTLKLTKDITILMPTDEIIEDVQLFDGERDAHTEVINWSLSNNSVLRNFSVKDIAFCPQIINYNYYTAEQLDSLGNGGFLGCCFPNPCNSLCMALDSSAYESCFNEMLIDCKNLNCKCKFFFCQLGSVFNKKLKVRCREAKKCRKLKKLLADMKLGNSPQQRLRNINNIRRNSIRPEALKAKVPLTQSEKRIMELTEEFKKADELIIKGYVKNETLFICKELDSLFVFYGVDNREDLIYQINKPLMEEFGVNTMEELLDTLPKANLENLEVKYRNKNISYDDYKFYIFNSSNLGYKNLDVFRKMKESEKTKLQVNVKPNKTNDCKLVFVDRKFVIPAKLTTNNFFFEGMPKNEKAWIVALKYENGKPFLGMKEIIIEDKVFDVEFEQLSLEELKQKLKILDF